MPVNVGFIHTDCADQRQKDWQSKNQALVIEPGDFVQLPFTDGLYTEHMWVTVAISGTDMIGNLNNDPVYLDIKDGDEVKFKRSDIEGHIKG